jgi:hypothetical protein
MINKLSDVFLWLDNVNNNISLPKGFSVESIPNLSEHDRVYMEKKQIYK